jgi:DMSO reductase anchor subunit
MHPAPSVILFTALSGLGFGLFFWLGLGIPNVTGVTAFVFFFVAYGLSVSGLLASTFHLGNPQRALLAFTQWRTSWLSREGIVSVATLLIMAPFAIGRIFYDVDLAILGWIGAMLSLVTVYCTAMIYGQLKTVPRWNTAATPMLMLAFSVSGGALLAGQTDAAGLAFLALTAMQIFAWRRGDRRFAEEGSTIETATGLGPRGKVRLLESPHSGSNYLLKEMVHIVGRKHATRLRGISVLCVGLIPGTILIAFPASHGIAGAALGFHLIGLFTARWLFFAEAEHVVGLYYGKR